MRSYDWYLLEPWKRAAIMKNHGLAGKGFGDLVTSTLATFSLSDYEWVVSLEGDDINRLVDLMYAFRNTEARYARAAGYSVLYRPEVRVARVGGTPSSLSPAHM